jgi:hypothetical protein
VSPYTEQPGDSTNVNNALLTSSFGNEDRKTGEKNASLYCTGMYPLSSTAQY